MDLMLRPATKGAAITTNDTTNLPKNSTKGIYVGVAGDVKVTTAAGSVLTFKAAPVGILPVNAKQVFATGTAATNLIALY